MLLPFLRVCVLSVMFSLPSSADVFDVPDVRREPPPPGADWLLRRFWDPDAPDLTEEEWLEYRVRSMLGEDTVVHGVRDWGNDPEVMRDPRIQARFLEARAILFNPNPTEEEFARVWPRVVELARVWPRVVPREPDQQQMRRGLEAYRFSERLYSELKLKLEAHNRAVPMSDHQILSQASLRALAELTPGMTEEQLLAYDRVHPELGLRQEYQARVFRYEIQIREESTNGRRAVDLEWRALPPEVQRWLRQQIEASPFPHSESLRILRAISEGRSFASGILSEPRSPYLSPGHFYNEREIVIFGSNLVGRHNNPSVTEGFDISAARGSHTLSPSAFSAWARKQAKMYRPFDSGGSRTSRLTSDPSTQSRRSSLRAIPQSQPSRVNSRAEMESGRSIDVRVRRPVRASATRAQLVISETDATTLAPERRSVLNRSIVADMTVEQAAATIDGSRRVAIPSLDGGQIRTVEVRSSAGERLREGRDFTVLRDSRDGGYVLQMSDAHAEGQSFRVEATFQSQPRSVSRRQAEPVVLDRARVEALTRELEADGFTAISSRLRARLSQDPDRPILDHEVEGVFKEAGSYTYDTRFRESSGVGQGRFARFRGYLDNEGRVCAQCDGTNGMFRVFVEGALPDGSNLEVRNRTVLVMEPGEAAIDFTADRVHADTALSDPGGLRRRLDVTPSGSAESEPRSVTAEEALRLRQNPEIARARVRRDQGMVQTLREGRARLARDLSGSTLPEGASRPSRQELRGRTLGNTRAADRTALSLSEAVESFLAGQMSEADFRNKLFDYLGRTPDSSESTQSLVTRVRERTKAQTERLQSERRYRQGFSETFGPHQVYADQVIASTERLLEDTVRALDMIESNVEVGARESSCLRNVLDAAHAAIDR